MEKSVPWTFVFSNYSVFRFALYHMYEYPACMYVYAPCLFLEPSNIKRKHLTLWN